MADHILRVHMEPWGYIALQVECYASNESPCRQVCPEGCSDWTEDHHHKLVRQDKCNAVEWFEAEDPEDHCEETAKRFPIFDGMPIEIKWRNVGCYVWFPSSDLETKNKLKVDNWYEKLEIAKAAREFGTKLRKGKPTVHESNATPGDRTRGQRLLQM